jgi:hypothetical protein
MWVLLLHIIITCRGVIVIHNYVNVIVTRNNYVGFIVTHNNYVCVIVTHNDCVLFLHKMIMCLLFLHIISMWVLLLHTIIVWMLVLHTIILCVLLLNIINMWVYNYVGFIVTHNCFRCEKPWILISFCILLFVIKWKYILTNVCVMYASYSYFYCVSSEYQDLADNAAKNKFKLN